MLKRIDQLKIYRLSDINNCLPRDGQRWRVRNDHNDQDIG